MTGTVDPALAASLAPGLLADLMAARACAWFNPRLQPAAVALPEAGLGAAEVQEAADRLRRFAPWLAEAFPATRASGGIIESPLVAVPALQAALDARRGMVLPGRLWLKLDSALPISGSIKARGGIHEVLRHAERLALDAGLLALQDDYRRFAAPELRALLGRHRIAVGSTGNLGLSIGIIGAQLGFQVTVHMSADARQWKKDRLRAHGVTVVEHAADYSAAVAEGRAQAAADPLTYFVDDENSPHLFLGYAVAAQRLAGQLQALDLRVGPDRPLFVYLPCGVGGGPGGVAFGLKLVFGDHVHCLFAEPTHAPCMLLGLASGWHEDVSVHDIGLDGVTAADGLAVARPSGFVGRRLAHLIDGCFTVDDDELFRLVALLHQHEGLDVEPSAVAGLPGPWHVARAAGHLQRLGIGPAELARSTHIAWATGGSMVPAEEMAAYIAHGAAMLS
ncbi:MAG TPA: D-serine ammonia-lyase [Ottowia sp.]|uniref:D-serine ammonia-lyase n=1 Tax=Ottowia sp. TaxID=1898956 RepID=UPI002CE0EA6D|nr:D-serine ammonia-lyase [Ottowia sp.]HMN20659.1 D-serine ammonia-lyase [Ottowia sp.]